MIRSRVCAGAFLSALVFSAAASVPSYAHAQVALKFEVQGLDLDTGSVSDGLYAVFEAAPEADLLIAYNSGVTPHSVLEGNERSGVQLAFVDKAFESVTSEDLAGLSFSRMMERPFGGAGTFVVRSSGGVHFKLGHTVESADGISFDTAQLSSGGGSAGVLSGPSSGAALPPGVTAAEWSEITRQILGVPQHGIASATALACGLCLIFGCVVLVGLALGARGRFRSRRLKWGFAGVLALSFASVAYASPVFFESAAIHATPGDAGDQFGFAIAATADILFVGAPTADNGTVLDSGAVYVFDRDAAGHWVQQTRLAPNDPAAGGNFGAAVAIDGDTLLIGAPGANSPVSIRSGAAYVFKGNGGAGWFQAQKLTADDASINDAFGMVVALSGNLLMVAAPNDDSQNPPPFQVQTPDVGAVYVYKLNDSTWTMLQSKLLPPLNFLQSDRFGARIALDGNIAVINATQSTRTGFYIYEREDTDFNYPFLLTMHLNTLPDDVPNNNAMLVLDGDRLAIGSTIYDTKNADGTIAVGDSGAVAIYQRNSATSWTLSGKMVPSNPTVSGNFGTAIAFRGDTVVASKRFTVASPGEGYVFTRDAQGVWTEDARLQPTTPISGERFGLAVAIAGESALVGAPGATSCSPTPCTIPKGNVYEYVVISSEPPALTVPGTITAEATFSGGATVTFVASATDAVDGAVTPVCTPASGTTFPLGTNVVTCTATDSDGNAASASFNVQVVDTTDPDAQCTNIVKECTGPGTTPVDASCTATDTVDEHLEITTSNLLPSYPVGTHQYFCAALDDSNNSESLSCTVQVQDTTPPTCIPPATGFISCDSPGGVPRGQALVTQHISQFHGDDLCSSWGVSINGPDFLPASCDGFASTFTYTVNDSRNNHTTCSTDIVVTDNGGVLVTCPDSTQLECNSTGGVAASDANVASWLGEAAAEDACNDVALTSTAPALYPLGTTRVFFTGEDTCGNTSSCPAEMTVVDTTPPQVACANVAVECTGALTPVTTSCSALDVCDAAPATTSTARASYALGTHAYICETVDGSGNGAQTSCQIKVADTTAPVLSGIVTTLVPVQIGTTIQASAHFTDACGPHSGTFSWGDGLTSAAIVGEGAGQGDASASHAYATPGVYTVSLTLSDASGNSSSTVFQYVVAFDPQGGYVTGAGAIESPAGAYAPLPAMTGRAQFGFQAKYSNGATTPTGNTQFRFRAADLDFDSTSYDWLVVAGSKAKYKGVGTLNGVGGYSFMLTATDGGSGGSSDKFRMKIWNASQGVVYDNQRGDADDGDATQAITSGNIMVHKP